MQTIVRPFSRSTAFYFLTRCSSVKWHLRRGEKAHFLGQHMPCNWSSLDHAMIDYNFSLFSFVHLSKNNLNTILNYNLDRIFIVVHFYIVEKKAKESIKGLKYQEIDDLTLGIEDLKLGKIRNQLKTRLKELKRGKIDSLSSCSYYNF